MTALEDRDDDCANGLNELFIDVMPLDLVSAIAGDRQLNAAETAQVEQLRASRGDRFYSDLLYTVTRQYFRSGGAEDLWRRILAHKCVMSSAMKRNVRISVASLDYLSNLEQALHSATVIAEERVTEMVRRSVRDDLTGLFNHSFCYRRLAAELALFARHGTPVSLAMADIDDFKAVNDRHGHQTGDGVLAGVAAVIGEAARKSDVCCRYGGEEFALILPSTDISEARSLAERLRSAVAQQPIAGTSVTISVGVASCSPGNSSPESLVSRADGALYRAKAGGKNRVEVAD